MKKWLRSLFAGTSRPIRRRPAPRPLYLEALELRLTPSVDVTMYHFDNQSTGVNYNEIQLTPANVQVGSFGKEFTTSVLGQVYAQPLVKNNVTIAIGPNTVPGAAGVHNVAFVATENDYLYAIDSTSGAVLWRRNFLDTSNPDNGLPGATAIAPVSPNDVGTTDLSPSIGITGTPVIDPSTNLLYVITKTKESVNGTVHFVQRLHAINLSDGSDAVTPYVIGDTTGDNTNNTQIYVYGTGDGSVTDPYNGTGQSVVQFNALHENNRMALSLVNGNLYGAWAAHGDNGPYHGWIMSWNVSNILSQGFQLDGVLNATPNGGGGGIWDGAGQLSFEPDGSALYALTGNGNQETITLDGNGFPTTGDYNESLLKVVADPTTSATNQNLNGWGLKVADYFTPFNQPQLDAADQDFGSGAPIVLPDSAGIPGQPHLLVCAGKDGQVYLIDRDNMGKYDPNNDHVVNAVPDGSGHNTAPVLINGLLSTPAYYNGALYLVTGYNGPVESVVINANGTLSVTSHTQAEFGYLPGSPVISANGNTNGLLWEVDRDANALRVYSTSGLANELWDSNQNPTGADQLGAAVKFAAPTVANGEVFVGTSNSLVVYGLTPPAASVPNAPVLSASALSDTSVRLSWTDSTPPPNTSSGYVIEQSTDGVHFTQVTTAAAGATSIDIGGLTRNTTYSFYILGFNGQGYSNPSNTVQVTTQNNGVQAPLAPSGLGATAASATSVNLTWINNSTNEDGFYLDRATDVNFTQNLVTQTLLGAMNSYTDTATGLAPGGVFYYRLRAYNSGGTSNNSNLASVAIPVAPPKPTNAQVTNVSSTEVDLSWTDNAGLQAQGYQVLRAANHGTFTVVANLPSFNHKPPNTYTWNDTTVTPGTFYEYHIEAYNVSGHNDFTGTNTTTLCAPPTGVTATAGNGVVNLSWTASTGAVSYNVYRGTTAGGEDATPLATGITGTTYSDTSVTNGQAYFYVVTAVNANLTPQPNESLGSAEVSATPAVPPPISPPPPVSPPAPPAASWPQILTFTDQFDGLLNMVLHPITPDGTRLGAQLVVPFPVDFLFGIQQVKRDQAGDFTVTLHSALVDLLFHRDMQLTLEYNSAGGLIGAAL